MITREQCPNHIYFRLADGKLSCDACGRPPDDGGLVRVYTRNRSASPIEDKGQPEKPRGRK